MMIGYEHYDMVYSAEIIDTSFSFKQVTFPHILKKRIKQLSKIVILIYCGTAGIHNNTNIITKGLSGLKEP